MRENSQDSRDIIERAKALCEDAGGSPEQFADYLEKARELTAMERAPHSGLVPLNESKQDSSEPLEAVENQGEFPTLTDQGKDNPAPLRSKADPRKP